MNTRLILGVLTGVAFTAWAAGACGQVSGGFAYAPAWLGYGYPSTYVTEAVPYYSLYPPVYYSCRVARTYGYSPFAYPPGVMTPGSEPPRSVTQYAYPAGEMSESQQSPAPLRIDNPFVERRDGREVTGGRKPTGYRPQVVYPAAMARRSG